MRSLLIAMVLNSSNGDPAIWESEDRIYLTREKSIPHLSLVAPLCSAHLWLLSCEVFYDPRILRWQDHCKTENTFSPLPTRSKASNADMTALSRLQDYRPAYCRKFLPPRCSPANKDTGHGSRLAAVAGFQTAYMRTLLPCCSVSFSNCIQALCSHLQ
jgi:hypothetical protein